MGKKAIGIDIGGTGIKGAIVDVTEGVLLTERIRMDTPEGGRPEEITEVVRLILKELKSPKDTAVGICFPAVVQNGVAKSAANVSSEWIDYDADAHFKKALKRPVHMLNDADAAGYAEAKFGAAKRQKGLTILATLGTGIGTALLYNGTLIPNSELGHLPLHGESAEKFAAFSAKERDELSWVEWAERLQEYFGLLENLLVPDLFIVGGGVSKEHEEFLPLLRLKTPIVPAELKNSAGIIGAASLAKKHS